MCLCSPCFPLSTGTTWWNWASMSPCSSVSPSMSEERWVCWKHQRMTPGDQCCRVWGPFTPHTHLPVTCVRAGLQGASDPSYSHTDAAQLLLDFKLHPNRNHCDGASWLLWHTAGGQCTWHQTNRKCPLSFLNRLAPLFCVPIINSELRLKNGVSPDGSGLLIND